MILAPAVAVAQPFVDATDRCFGTTAEWTNRAELADLDGDGDLDIVFANGGDDTVPGTPEPVRAWSNLGAWGTPGVRCTEITTSLGVTALSRVVRAVDVDGDGDLDLIAGGAYQTQLRLLVNGAGAWTDGTAQLPQQLTSVGDVEVGDVDGDGDLDLVIADWGADLLFPTYPGGRTRLYLNDGAGTFTEATSTRMPDELVKWSRDLELVDIDGDWDLDLIVACVYCTASYVFANDGTGTFAVVEGVLPAVVTKEIEPVDLDGDGRLDLIALDADAALRERVFMFDSTLGVYVDRTSLVLSTQANPATETEDGAVAWAGEVIVIGGRDGDRMLVKQASGSFDAVVATPSDTPSTLGMAIGDLDDDGRPDLVNVQGYGLTADKLQLATTAVPRDETGPNVRVEDDGLHVSIEGRLRAHVTDRVHDLEEVWLEHDGIRAAFESPPVFAHTTMRWSGGALWTSPELSGVTNYRACARDRAGNTGCSDWVYVYNLPPGEYPLPHGDDAGVMTTPGDTPGGGCCDAGRSATSSLLLVLAVVPLVRRRRRRLR